MWYTAYDALLPHAVHTHPHVGNARLRLVLSLSRVLVSGLALHRFRCHFSRVGLRGRRYWQFVGIISAGAAISVLRSLLIFMLLFVLFLTFLFVLFLIWLAAPSVLLYWNAVGNAVDIILVCGWHCCSIYQACTLPGSGNYRYSIPRVFHSGKRRGPL